MDLFTEKGQKIIFTGEGGYDYENKLANETLSVGNEYIVKSVDVGSWSSTVYIEGFKQGFNTVMFENI